MMKAETEDHELIETACEFLFYRKNIIIGDPLLVNDWNENRLQQLGADFPNAKEQILSFMEEHGGELLQPDKNNFVFFREMSHLLNCHAVMKQSLGWAFAAI